MKISEMITILQETMKKTGDVEVQGVCWNCQRDDLDVTILEDGKSYAAVAIGELEDD